MKGKGVKKIVEAMILALMLMLLLAEHSSMAATSVDHVNADDDQCIPECIQACSKYRNCELACTIRCAVQLPIPLTSDGNLDGHCKLPCSIAPQCIRIHDKNRRRRCIAECERTCMANGGRDS